MHAPRLVRPVDRTRLPWKNGLGVTEQVAFGPGNEDPPAWRISVAALKAGTTEFSAFPDIDRIFTVIGEHGVTFSRTSGRIAVQPWKPHHFDGQDPPRCTPSGDTTALNVMVHRSRFGASVEHADLHETALTTRRGEVTALFVRSGSAAVQGISAAAHDFLIIDGGPMVVMGDARGLVVRITPN
jgi:environmental stress-induced protein Ves